MPTVPMPEQELNNPGVRQSADAPNIGALNAQSQQALGQGLMSAGNGVNQIALDMAQQANEAKVIDASNQLAQQRQALTFGDGTNGSPQGFTRLLGNDALSRPNGQSLVDEYGGKLKQGYDDIMGGLTNDDQRRQFLQLNHGVLPEFQQQLMQHQQQQFYAYNNSVYDGAVATAKQNATLYANDPLQVHAAAFSIDQLMQKKGALNGWSPEEIQAQSNAHTSQAVSGAITANLDRGNYAGAANYLQQYKGQMEPNDLLSATHAVTELGNATLAASAVGAVSTAHQDAFVPNDQGRLLNLVANQESGGQDYNKDGTPVTSKAGAKYMMQVMPAVAANPGFGIKPAANDSPAEYNRVGQQLVPALLQKYGDVEQALAAYNDGSGNVDKYIAEAKENQSLIPQYQQEAQKDALLYQQNPTPQNLQKAQDSQKALLALEQSSNWKSYLPKETSDYVANISQAYNAGAGRPPIPSKIDFFNSALTEAQKQNGGVPLTLAQVSAVRNASDTRWEMLDQTQKQAADNAYLTYQRASIAVNGNAAAIPPSIKQNLNVQAPQKVADANNFDKSLVDGVNATNLQSYNWAIQHPDQLAAMSDADFNQFQQTQLGGKDRETIAQLRQKTQTGTYNDGPGSLHQAEVNNTVNLRLRQMGVALTDNSNDNQTKIGAVRRFVNDTLLDSQKNAGKKFSQQEIEQQVDGIFAKNVTFQQSHLMGFVHTTETKPLFNVTMDDIPGPIADQIRSNLSSRSLPATDADVLRTYWRVLANKK